MKKKFIIIFILPLILLICFVGYSFLNQGYLVIGSETQANQILTKKANDVGQLVIRTGSGKELTTADMTIYQKIGQLKVRRCIVRPFGGYSYHISVSTDNASDSIMLAGKIITINQKNYSTNEDDIRSINNLIRILYEQNK